MADQQPGLGLEGFTEATSNSAEWSLCDSMTSCQDPWSWRLAAASVSIAYANLTNQKPFFCHPTGVVEIFVYYQCQAGL